MQVRKKVNLNKLMIKEYELALNKILRVNSLEKAKILASDALGLDVDDFVEDEDYLDEKDLVEVMNGY